jgi:hypothetical protein
MTVEDFTVQNLVAGVRDLSLLPVLSRLVYHAVVNCTLCRQIYMCNEFLLWPEVTLEHVQSSQSHCERVA